MTSDINCHRVGAVPNSNPSTVAKVKLGDVFQENPPVKARMGCHDSETFGCSLGFRLRLFGLVWSGFTEGVKAV